MPKGLGSAGYSHADGSALGARKSVGVSNGHDAKHASRVKGAHEQGGSDPLRGGARWSAVSGRLRQQGGSDPLQLGRS